MTITNAEAALLGLLSGKAMYGYELEKEIKFRDMRFWTDISFSAIYFLLNKLETKKLVEGKLEKSEKAHLKKKIFSITKAGKKALTEKLEKIFSEYEIMKWEIYVGISNLSVLPKAKIIKLLDQYEASVIKNIEGYKKLEAFLTDAKCPKYHHALAIRPLYLLEAELKWVKEYQKVIQNTF